MKTYNIWVGASCDYNRKDRPSAGAYIMELGGIEKERYLETGTDTTEFRMMLSVMIHAMTILPEGSSICFLSNVAYLQNFDKMPTEKSANADLILQCIRLKERMSNVSLKIVPYHKSPLLIETHEMAHEAMRAKRNKKE